VERASQLFRSLDPTPEGTAQRISDLQPRRLRPSQLNNLTDTTRCRSMSDMSIKVILQAPGLNLQASVKDEALGELIKITQEYRDQDAGLAGPASSGAIDTSGNVASAAIGDEEGLKARLSSHGAAELLNQMRWETYPEKILLLGAWHEARGGSTPWKSADMDSVFRQAKEGAPSNFPRDIKVAIKSGWIQTHTPRTYSVTRTGWNRIADALSKLG